jgi:nucleoid-associated protein YgaU
MSKILAGLGGNTGAVLAGGAMVVALGLGAYFGFKGGPDAAVQTVPPQAQDTVAKDQDTGANNQEIAPVAEIDGSAVPTFDEVRRETDGTTIIAGRAEPLSDVTIMVDGAQVARATADSSGRFAAITTLPPNDAAQVVSLSAQKGEDVVASLDEIILAPSASAAPQQPETTAVDADEAVAPAAAAAEEAEETPRISVLKSDEQGVQLLSPDTTEVMTAVALDTIGYSEQGEVQLTGRAQADTAQVRVYLDNRSVISLPVGADGRWRGDLPEVDEGVYTLRVDEVTQAGAVSSRVETPFKRESAAVLAQASANVDGPVASVTVQAGATLWAIARERYGDGTLFLRVFEANADNIRDPDLIYPGQVFDLPN